MMSLRAATRSLASTRGLNTAARIPASTIGLRPFSSSRAALIENTRTRADGGPDDIPHHGVNVDKQTSMHL